MKVRNLMTTDIVSCPSTDALDAVAKALWDHDCGAVFLRDAGGDVVGVLTDRDIAMTAWMQGRALHDISAASTLGRQLHSCSPDDDVATALDLMAEHQIRRLPVRDGNKWVGVVSLADVALAVDKGTPRSKSVSQAHVAHSLAAVCTPRAAGETAMEIRPAQRPVAPPSGPATPKETPKKARKPADKPSKRTPNS